MRTMDPGYPKPITIWKGIPDSPQGAFVDKANGTAASFMDHITSHWQLNYIGWPYSENPEKYPKILKHVKVTS